MSAPEIVVLGGPNSGKTHFAGQLYGRLQRRPGALRIRKDAGTPADLSALEEVLRCLESGHAAGHTATSTWAEVHLPLVNAQGHATDLRWPDYGGEQLNTVTSQRSVSETWRARMKGAGGWLLFIRLNSETTYPDALQNLTNKTHSASAEVRAGAWDANARLVELLQILLHVSEIGTRHRLSTPRLTVLLSCYDELNETNSAPRDVLAARLPLLAAFIESTWAADSVSIWGLSALGRALDSDSSDDGFIDDGPEHQGWVIPPAGGDQDSDLSAPLAWLLEGL